MVPVKAHKLCQEVAEKINKDPELVDAVTSFYWSEIKKTMIEGTAHNIIVHNYGTFRARLGRVNKLIKKYDDQLKNLEPTTFRKCQIIEEVNVRRNKILNIKRMILTDLERRDEIKKKRNAENNME